jgi:thioredoxin reductase
VSAQVDVLVVGGGPAGLAAATALRAGGAGRVVVLEREREPGGIPRHADHGGFGVRDLRRALRGPAYAARRAAIAAAAGAEIRTSTQATGWAGPLALETTSPAGREVLEARAVLLATGCRERPRSARLVSGARPAGVMTTGMLQQLVYLERRFAGRRAVVVGAELVSFSALLTLAHGGARCVAMTTELPGPEAPAPLALGARARFGAPLRTRTALTGIEGEGRVEAVRLTDLATGASERVACDTVVFTAGWIPDHELAVLGGAALDPGTRGPATGPALHTSADGVFAAGNLLHGAEPADVAALGGAHAAGALLAHLRGVPWPARRVPVRCAAPLAWISPNAIDALATAAAPPRGRFLLRAAAPLRRPRVVAEQDGRVLLDTRLRRLGPGASAALPADWAAAADPAGGPVTVRVAAARGRA